MRVEQAAYPAGLIMLALLASSPSLAVTLLGTEVQTGTVYQLNTLTGVATSVAETTEAGSSFSPNGNASDASSDRFFYATIPASGPSELYFLSLPGGVPVHSGQLAGRAPDGAFYDGSYYYIDSGTDDLRRVTLDASGEILADTKTADLVGDQYGWGFGDIEIRDDGLLIVRGGRTDDGQVLFQYDLVADSFVSEHAVSFALQIAFGDDGVLYGTSTAGKLYSIDLASGQDTELADITGLQGHFTDLARFIASNPPPVSAEVLAGTETLTGTIYKLDTGTGVALAIEQTDVAGLADSPNGNAFDESTRRFFYATIPASGPSELYFLSLPGGVPVHSGQLAGRAPDGAFYDGSYYYIDSGTDDLRRVTLDASGEILADTKTADLVGDQYGWGFGDIEIRDDGLLIVRGGRTDDGQVLFQYDLVADSFVSEHAVSFALQIAFGDDGVLYGTSTAGKLYSIDLASGQDTELADITGLQGHFTDLARFSIAPQVPSIGLGGFVLLASVIAGVGARAIRVRV
jgi:outer membrane protein assembly factor BamB